MLCEMCQKNVAVVHLTTENRGDVRESGPRITTKHHFCEDCADKYFASMPGMNASRDLIQLSDRCRSKLYDLLEVEHPEVFQRGDNDHLFECANIMGKFLFEQLKREGVELNEGGFGMLLGGFIGSAEYYERCDRREGGA